MLDGAQLDVDRSTPQYIDLTDLGTLIRGKNSKKKGTGIPEKGKLMAFAAPSIGSNPSLGAFYGLGGTGAMFLGRPDKVFTLPSEKQTKRFSVVKVVSGIE